jgi:hypothetical protein
MGITTITTAPFTAAIGTPDGYFWYQSYSSGPYVRDHGRHFRRDRFNGGNQFRYQDYRGHHGGDRDRDRNTYPPLFSGQDGGRRMMTGGAMIVAVMAGVVMTGSCGATAGAAMVRRGGIRRRRSRAGGIGMTIVGATDAGRMGAAATMADRRRCLAAPRRLSRVIASLNWMADRREVGVVETVDAAMAGAWTMDRRRRCLGGRRSLRRRSNSHRAARDRASRAHVVMAGATTAAMIGAETAAVAGMAIATTIVAAATRAGRDPD